MKQAAFGLGTYMKENVLVILAAGINTNKERDLFRELKAELEKRYKKIGNSVTFVEVFPLGEVKDTSALKQALEVGVHMHRGTGGEEVVKAVMENKNRASRIVLIGHSGGGQAVLDALIALEKKGIPIHHAVQIGAPFQLVDKKYVHKVTRVQVKTDYVSENVRTGTEAIPHSFNSVAGLISSVCDIFTKRMPETRYVELNIQGMPWGGHSAYFKRELVNRHGTDNVTETVNSFWDKIK